MHTQPIYRMNGFVNRDGWARGISDAYVTGGLVGADGRPADAGSDIFDRGFCLPTDVNMTVEEQEKIIEVVKSCFK